MPRKRLVRRAAAPLSAMFIIVCGLPALAGEVSKFTGLKCAAAEDGLGLFVPVNRVAANHTHALLTTASSLAECPSSARIVKVANETPGKPPGTTVQSEDVREESTLHEIAKPFDFSKTLSTVDKKPVEVTPEDELAERLRISEEARWLYIPASFDVNKLEALFKDYRENKSRTVSGVWKLSRSYSFLATLLRNWTAKIDPNQPDWNKQRLDNWKAAYPQSPTPYIFESAIHFYRAHAFLNDRLARSTFPGGEPALIAKLEEARAVLENNKAIAASDPHYYSLLVLIMRNQGAGIDDILHVALEGADRHPEYFDTYFEAVNAIGHRSKKPFEDLESLANTALTKTSGTLGDEIYIRIYWYALQTIFNLGDMQRLNWDWTKAKASMETVLSRYPAQWNIQNFAQVSCYAGDAEHTKKMIAMVKGRPLPEVWSQSQFFEACQHFAEAPPAPRSPESSGEPETRKAWITEP